MATKEDSARANLTGLQKVGEGWHMLVAVALDRGEHKALDMERRDYAIAAGRPRLDSADDQKQRIRELLDAGVSQTAIAEILGLSTHTVRAYREEAGAPRADVVEGSTAQREIPDKTGAPRADVVEGTAEEDRPLTQAERREEIAAMLDEGNWSTAAMADELGVSPATIGKDVRAIKIERARQEKEANAPSEPERKANEATMDEAATGIKKSLASMQRVDAYVDSAIETVDQVEELGGEIQNFDWVVGRYIELGQRLWQHGARRGFDVSKISEAIRRFEEEQS